MISSETIHQPTIPFGFCYKYTPRGVWIIRIVQMTQYKWIQFYEDVIYIVNKRHSDFWGKFPIFKEQLKLKTPN